MRFSRSIVLLVPFLLLVPSAPAHDESMVVWDLPCSSQTTTSTDMTVLNTRNVAYTPGELDVSDTHLVASRWGSGGFQLFSLANPAAPTPVSSIGTAGTALDIKFSADGKTVFVGNHGAIRIIDITNPSSPSFLRSALLPIAQDQGHMLHSTVIGGQEYLLAAAQSGSGVYIFEVTGTGTGRDLVRIAQFAPGSPLGAHDMYVQNDPVLDKPILYVANGFAGWIAADLSDPSQPLPLAVVPNIDLGQSYLHTVLADVIDGRRIVVTIAELGANILRVWDATILSAPVLLATWSADSDTGVVPSLSSQHNIQIVDGKLYVAHYRCGFFVFDLETLPSIPGLALADPIRPIAAFAPQHSNGQHWDVVLKDGYLYTSDMRMGGNGAIYTVHHAALTLGDPALTSKA